MVTEEEHHNWGSALLHKKCGNSGRTCSVQLYIYSKYCRAHMENTMHCLMTKKEQLMMIGFMTFNGWTLRRKSNNHQYFPPEVAGAGVAFIQREVQSQRVPGVPSLPRKRHRGQLVKMTELMVKSQYLEEGADWELSRNDEDQTRVEAHSWKEKICELATDGKIHAPRFKTSYEKGKLYLSEKTDQSSQYQIRQQPWYCMYIWCWSSTNEER